eukprot:TRINITY_DN9840_c0_g2_i1.p1 TRINITY_DN9840_c0_g2~~TRINITY_DN9840_c0_g2_i1.p1  ORF type:complete len:840 (+),score=203.26 TRINITY_DN9840_c0_g2_i1:52-2571(+)
MQRAGGSSGSMRGRPGTVVVPVPAMGDARSCTVIEWPKAVGSKIKVGEVLCYVERNEVTDEVRSTVAGVLVEQCAALEETVSVGADLVVIDVNGGQAPEAVAAAPLGAASAVGAELLAAQERLAGLQQAEREAAEILKQLVSGKAGGFPLPPGLSLGKAGSLLPPGLSLAGATLPGASAPIGLPPGLSLAGLQVPGAAPGAADFQWPASLLGSAGLTAATTAAAAAELQRSLGSELTRSLAFPRPPGPPGLQAVQAAAAANAVRPPLEFPRPPAFPQLASLQAAAAAGGQSQPRPLLTGSGPAVGGPRGIDFRNAAQPPGPLLAANPGGSNYQQNQRPQRSGQQGSGQTAASIAAAVAKATAASQAAANAASDRREKAAPKEEQPKEEDKIEKLRCHLHKKVNKACKFCQRYQSAKAQADEEALEKQQKVQHRPAAETFNCSPLLKEQIVGCSYYKSLMGTELSVPELINEIMQFATDTMEAYRNSMEPSCFMCCVYRLFTLQLNEDELRRFVDYPDSPLVRCVGLLCMRYCVPSEQLWEKLEDYVLDDAEIIISDSRGGEGVRMIGEYVEDLLLKEKYFTTPLPRIPASVRRKLEENLAPMVQYRKRTMANRGVFGEKRQVNFAVEAYANGMWVSGRATDVNHRIPSRPMVRVHLDSGGEIVVHIGKVVLQGNGPQRSGSRSRSRGRSRSRSRERKRDNSPDWSYTKGKTDQQLIEELRERGRVDAVCSHRKDYAKRLPRFESGLAIKREKGSAEAKLIEEETFIAPGMRRRPESNIVEEEERLRGEHLTKRRTDEEDERQRRLKDIYEKYGATGKKAPEKGAASRGDLEGPDTMRLG